MCENQATISSKLQACCDKPVLQKSQCLAEIEHDNIPADLPSIAADFVEDKEKQIKKQTALAELVKHKPKATEDQLKTVMGDFAQFVDKCCKAADKDNCFATEGPNLVARSKEALA
ncbi:albumin, isoform CRA_b [Rattus norvegicus]|uniref:Albumin n=1 Tax=Rattus norvegicus TaxID=10116 RepID=A6KKG1_RAT|nr:albumin, isoform CRA_b [Rattus norvegicus]